MQNFYGRAIRYNKGDAKSMAQATKAILKHNSSAVEKPQHEDCPKVLSHGVATSETWQRRRKITSLSKTPSPQQWLK